MFDKKIINNILMILAGSCILAFATYNLNYQNNVTEGGVLGLLLLIKNLFNVSPSTTAIIIDLSLFALGYKVFGKRFLILSIFASISFSSWHYIWEGIGFVVPNLQHNMLLASILAGIGVGVGIGIIVRAGAAAGGDDVIALIGTKITKLKINHMYLITDLIVLGLSLIYLDFEQIFFSLLAVTISGKIISLFVHDDDSCENVITA